VEKPNIPDLEFVGEWPESEDSSTGSPSSPATFHYAPFPQRFYAYAADNTFLAAFVVFMVGVAVNMPGISLRGLGEDRIYKLLIYIILFYHLLSAAYYTLGIALYGTTFGKNAMGVRVAMLDGSSVSVTRAFIRFLGYYPGAMLMYLGFAWALVDPRSQTLHDKLASTVVLEIE